MAESGCLKSEKLHTLTIIDDIVTNNFETSEHMSLTLGTDSFRELNDASADLINGTFKDVNKDNDADQKTNTVGGLNNNDSVNNGTPSEMPGLRRPESLTGLYHYVGRPDLSQLFTGAPSALGEPIVPLDLTEPTARDNRLNSSGGSSSNVHKITQPPWSILKNMYVIVQNNNVSISQFIGNQPATTTGQVADGEAIYPDLNNYEDIRLQVVKKDASGTLVPMFEEDSTGGSINDCVRGNDITGVSPTEETDPSARELADFRHSGALLPKNTIIPVVSNYLFSTQEEKSRSICANGYLHPDATLDKIRLSSQEEDNLEISFSNFTDNENEIYVTLDSSVGTDSNRAGLTGITQAPVSNDVLTIGDEDGEAEGENGLKVITKNRLLGTTFTYLSNRVRDSTFINPEISNDERDAGEDTGIPIDMYKGDGGSMGAQTDDTILGGTQYKNNVVFKVICDFQRIDQSN